MECQHTAADREQEHVCDDGARQHGGDQEAIVNQKAMAATGQARMEAPGGVEPPTCGLGNRRSIHLSYGATFVINILRG